jgi:hypothetical protein
MRTAESQLRRKINRRDAENAEERREDKQDHGREGLLAEAASLDARQLLTKLFTFRVA